MPHCTTVHGMKWKENFGMEYGRCQNGTEWKILKMKDYLPYFHTNSILDFVQAIYKKCIRIVKNNIFTKVCSTFFIIWENHDTLVVCIAQTVYNVHIAS